MKKQFISKLLVLVMVLAMVPATALVASAAADTNEGSNAGSGLIFVLPDTTVSTPATSKDDTTTTTDPAEEEETNVDAADIVVEDGAASIEATVVDGTATVVLSEAAVESLADLAQDGQIVLQIKDEGAGKLSASFPAKALTALAQETGADLTIQSSVATISIPNEVLSNELGTSGNVKITAQATESSVGFTIEVSGKALKGIKGVQVTF